MKTLYVTNKPIYPIVDGGCFAMDSFLQSLLTFSEVITLCISTHKHPFHIENYPSDIVKSTNPKGVFINTKTNPISFLKSVLKNESYNTARFYSTSFSTHLQTEINSNQYDSIILESAYLLVYLDELRATFKGKIILRAPNVEYKIWEDYHAFSTSFFKKKIYHYLAKKLKQFEIDALSKVDLVCAITENDKLQLIEDGIPCPIAVIPFGIKQNFESNATIEQNKLFFLGAYNWKPNYDAALFLVKEILPELIQSNHNIQIHLAGSFMPEEFYSFASKNLHLHGKVVSSEEFISKHGILVAPIFSGSGVRIKIVEALASGIPVIASTIAMQGIPTNAVLLADNKTEFIAQIKKLVNSEEERIYLRQKAIEVIHQEFSFESVSNKLSTTLHGI